MSNQKMDSEVPEKEEEGDAPNSVSTSARQDDDDGSTETVVEQDTLRRSVRHKIPTEKGLTYMLETKERRLRETFRHLEHKCAQLDEMMSACANDYDVRNLYAHWSTLFEEFLDNFDDLASLMSDENLGIIQTWFSPRKNYLIEHKAKVNDWLLEDKLKLSNSSKQEQINPEDSVSRATKRSSRSSHSSSIASAKLKEKQLKAELEVQAAALLQRQELEQIKLEMNLKHQQEQLNIKMKQEELDIKEKMAICESRTEVLESETGHKSSHSHKYLDHSRKLLINTEASVMSLKSNKGSNCDNKNPLEPKIEVMNYPKTLAPNGRTQQSSLNVDAHSFTPFTNPFTHVAPTAMPDLSPSEEGSTRSEEALVSVVRHLRRPVSDIQKFNGDPLQFNRFIRQFHNRIVCNTENDEERMGYLEQFTTGEAYKIISGYSYLDAKQGYSAAMTELKERYGDVDVVVHAFITKALNWPVIKPDNVKALDEFSVFLNECENAVQSMEAMKVLEYSENLKKLVSKLPYHLHDKWRNIVFDIKDRGETVKFSRLVQFLKRESKKANDPTYGRVAMTNNDHIKSAKGQNLKQNTMQRQKGSFAVDASDKHKTETQSLSSQSDNKDSTSVNKVKPEPKAQGNKSKSAKELCVYCDDVNHLLEQCPNLFKLKFNERIEILKKKGLCFGCLKAGHLRQNCQHKMSCKHCNGKHPSVLHFWKLPQNADPDKSHTEDQVSAACNKPPSRQFVAEVSSHMGGGDSECTMAVLPVRIRRKNGIRDIITYAFLDPGSNVTFCSENLKNQLGGSGKTMHISMNTMGIPYSFDTELLKDLVIGDLDNISEIELPNVYTKKSIPISHNHIPTTEDISAWPHLEGIFLPQVDAEIGLLIGNNVPDAYTPMELRTGPRNTPYAAKTLLGWVAWNVIRHNNSNEILTNRADVIAIQQVEELRKLNVQYQRSVNLDFPECARNDRKENSVEDNCFMAKMSNSQHFKDGHYELCLPFREESPKLPDNRIQATQRLNSLKKKLEHNSKFHADYNKFMKNIIDHEYAELVPIEELQRADGKVWFVPHHGVYHSQKPDKIRVVFDCSAKCRGVALNDIILQGPDLSNKLLGVLLRFRKENIAIMSDIECMFYQVQMKQQDRDCLRFNWWPEGNLEEDPLTYRMCVHLFGACSSPSCSNYALQQTIIDNHEHFDPSVCEAIKYGFYVDDFLYSIPSEQEAIELVKEVSFLCQLGGFHLTKWTTNSRTVLQSIDEQERAKTVKDLNFTEFPVERALGVHWNVDSDKFGFQVKLRECQPTRRSILSLVSSIYDPLGFASPVVLQAKMILQDACRKKLNWDDELTETDLEKWQNWLMNLPKLDELLLPRCLKPNNFGSDTSIQLHHFADASEMGYGVTTYIRFINELGQIHCSLLLSRSRVAPLKKTTILRMELTAATVAVRLGCKMVEELHIDLQCQTFWTDSLTVIRYIANETTRFHTFVANRVAVIRDCTSILQWRYIESKNNPADMASRGMDVDTLLQAKTWIQGPKFLWYPETQWPDQPHDVTVLQDHDPEVKNVINTADITVEHHFMDQLALYTSSWMKCKRIMALILLFIEKLKQHVTHRKDNQTKNVERRVLRSPSLSDPYTKINLTTELIQTAETILIKDVQHQFYETELHDLSKENTSVRDTSLIHTLDPFICDGILRVGGRLSRSELQFDAKHQVIIPYQSSLARILLLDIHRKVGHQGRNAMTAELRKKYWIPRLNSTIKSTVAKCVLCRRYRARLCKQKMADLPEDRVVSDEAPFRHSGMDFFGPFDIKRGRSTVKRYGVIFCCLSSRAVHLEVTQFS